MATPGRLLEHIEKEAADCRDIECLILDEADRMLDMGFSTVVNQIAAEARWRKQNLLFSATLEGKGLKPSPTTFLTTLKLLKLTRRAKKRTKFISGITLLTT